MWCGDETINLSCRADGVDVGVVDTWTFADVGSGGTPACADILKSTIWGAASSELFKAAVRLGGEDVWEKHWLS